MLSKINTFFSVLFTSWFFAHEMTCVRDGLYKTSLDTAHISSPTRHLAFIFVRPLVLCWCLFVLHLYMLVLHFVCLICINLWLILCILKLQRRLLVLHLWSLMILFCIVEFKLPLICKNVFFALSAAHRQGQIICMN